MRMKGYDLYNKRRNIKPRQKLFLRHGGSDMGTWINGMAERVEFRVSRVIGAIAYVVHKRASCPRADTA